MFWMFFLSFIFLGLYIFLFLTQHFLIFFIQHHLYVSSNISWYSWPKFLMFLIQYHLYSSMNISWYPINTIYHHSSPKYLFLFLNKTSLAQIYTMDLFQGKLPTRTRDTYVLLMSSNYFMYLFLDLDWLSFADRHSMPQASGRHHRRHHHHYPVEGGRATMPVSPRAPYSSWRMLNM